MMCVVDEFEYVTIECKWQLMLTDSGYDFHMRVPG